MRIGPRACLLISLACVGCGVQVDVSVTPNRVSLGVGQMLQLFALETTTCQGPCSLKGGVTWSVEEEGGGSVTPVGFSAATYQAPSAPGIFHIVATSGNDSSRSSAAEVTVGDRPVVTVLVSPLQPLVAVGASEQFIATVSGTPDTAVTWSIEEPTGAAITVNGLFSASTVGGFHVVATSEVDPSQSGFTDLFVTPQ